MVNQTLIGAIRAEATLESGKFVDGARKMRLEAVKTEGALKKSFGNIGGILAAGIGGFIGALGSGLIIQGIRQALEYASSLKEISQQLGVTTKDLQTFRFAAGQLGVKQQDLETGLQNLTKTLGQVAAGAERPRKALEAIGITAKELAGLDTGAAFRKIADALEQIPDRAQRAAIEVALFGERGQRLDNLLAGGSKAINELSDAAEKLGIVLSDEQIEKADKTADKLEALKTVLSARLAGVVADNADAILALADAISSLVGWLGPAINLLGDFANAISRLPNPPGWFRGFANTVVPGSGPVIDVLNMQNRLGPSATVRLPPPSPADGGAWWQKQLNIGQFLAPKPRSSRSRSSRGPSSRAPRDRSDDVTFEFAREQRQADMDILRAKRDLARTAEERLALDLQLLDLQQQDFEAELANRVRRAERDAAEGRITQGALEEVKAQAAILSAKNAEKVELERQALIEADQTRLAEEAQRLREVDFELQEEALRAQLDLAETAAERRDLELRLLDLGYRQERARLEAVIADEQSSEAAKEEARRRMAALNANFGARRQGVINSTRGPMEQFHADYSDITQELEELKVRGIESAVHALTELRHGWDAARDAAIQAIDAMVGELLRLQLMKVATSLFGGGDAGAQQSASAAQLSAAGATLTTAGGTLNAAGGMLTTAGGTLATGSASLTATGLGLNTAALSLQASAAVWMATAAQIQAAAAMLMAANAASAGAGGGFASGGYTGNIGVNKIAGVVHGREFVVNALATRQFLPLLQAINSGRLRGMADGGFAGITIPRASFVERLSFSNDNSGGGSIVGGGITVNAPITIQGNASRETLDQAAGVLRRRVASVAQKGLP